MRFGAHRCCTADILVTFGSGKIKINRITNLAALVPSVVDSDPDPDRYWICIQELPESGSVFIQNTVPDPDPHMQIEDKMSDLSN